MSYPSSIPSYAGFTSGHTLQQDTHAAQHNSEQTDITALGTKVGTGSATPSNNTLLRGNGAGTSTWAQANLTTDVTGILPTSLGGTGTTSTTGTGSVVFSNTPTLTTPVINAPTGTWIQTVYPIGCIYTETTGVNPNTTFGFGTWTAFGAGRVLVGNGTSDQAFTAGVTGGESNHTLTTAEMPSHNHDIKMQNNLNFTSTGLNPYDASGTFQSQPTASTGGGGAHNNLQPYIVVYFWKRVS